MTGGPEKRPFEGWAVREWPAVAAGVAVSLGLLVAVIAGTLLYDRYARSYTEYARRSFPEPQLETRSAPNPAARPDRSEDPAVEKAMRDLAREGAK
jgi:hypothetical protein